MQITNILKINERGESLENSQVNFVDVLVVLYKIEDFKNKYPWIATVDPYGDTVFNRIQIPYVLRDLKKLQTEKQELKAIIASLIIFLEKTDIHEYIKFIGD